MNRIEYFITAVLMICAASVHAQTFTKYYDSNWHSVPKEQAFYRTDFFNENDSYKGISYWQNSGMKYSETMYTDSSYQKSTGIEKTYYESGKLLDSIVFNNKDGYKSFDEFTESGKPKTHAYYDEASHDMIGEAYDTAGNKQPVFFTFQKGAAFPGGASAWISYLQKNLKSDVAQKHKAPTGIYTVIVSFLVDKKGKIIEVSTENDPGYGMAEEAVRVIQNAPDWIPAEQNNRRVIYRQRQPITFQVSR